MSSPRLIPLVRYHYDSLDRLLDCAPVDQPVQQRFYQRNRLASEIHGQVRHSYFQQPDSVLAQRWHHGEIDETTLLASDLQRSVLHALNRSQHQAMAYTPYGHRPTSCGLPGLLGFNGERADPVTGHYLLGNGYRAFNPLLMRFNSPDSMSPFARGGINAYAYCGGDPVGRVDPSGHVFKIAASLLGLVTVGLSVGAVFTDGMTRMTLVIAASLNGAMGVGSLFAAVRPPRYVVGRGRSTVIGQSPGTQTPHTALDAPPPPYSHLFNNSPRAPDVSVSLNNDVAPPSYTEAMARKASREAPPKYVEIEMSVLPGRFPASAASNVVQPLPENARRIRNN
ncbi:RHS repeat-associated core domain-containing protein [Pseudomonas sp. NFACC15-1]|uniref:RHS repeat-associated core domain-containing protein n=1 Tax=unclassified Pseudomonas TaxID=196821 RepID=UPI00087F5730|nr:MULTISPECIES: RHS repeat-associated core domain-containing protein [unclassified Pseudomonas]SDA87207.1 RHS repeat-associated core domain-containing protein [Pseudomonas sp. NFACC15-1]SDY78605.1 RHS repeat-associated core domain-containing protein [Pseudomonas sp. NFACC14]